MFRIVDHGLSVQRWFTLELAGREYHALLEHLEKTGQGIVKRIHDTFF